MSFKRASTPANVSRSLSPYRGLLLYLVITFLLNRNIMKNNCGDIDRTVKEFETPAATLLYEFLHLGVCEDIQAPFQAAGEVYGGEECAKLADDDEDKALENADNWMLVTI